ncbi:GTP-dependent dephospho-CoA kinase family protein [Natrialbaceae archaeon A-arb3/5]
MTNDDLDCDDTAESASSPTGPTDDPGDPEQVLILPDRLRDELKEPMGPIETDAERLLEAVDGPLIAVGDVVTHHFVQAGRPPDAAFVDGRTKRQAVDDEVRDAVTDAATIEARNPPAELTADVLQALSTAITADEPTTVFVEGEEDLLVLPALLVAPVGASVVYGQPDEGMVHVEVTDADRAVARDLLERFEGDTDRLLALLPEPDG